MDEALSCHLQAHHGGEEEDAPPCEATAALLGVPGCSAPPPCLGSSRSSSRRLSRVPGLFESTSITRRKCNRRWQGDRCRTISSGQCDSADDYRDGELPPKRPETVPAGLPITHEEAEFSRHRFRSFSRVVDVIQSIKMAALAPGLDDIGLPEPPGANVSSASTTKPPGRSGSQTPPEERPHHPADSSKARNRFQVAAWRVVFQKRGKHGLARLCEAAVRADGMADPELAPWCGACDAAPVTHGLAMHPSLVKKLPHLALSQSKRDRGATRRCGVIMPPNVVDEGMENALVAFSNQTELDLVNVADAGIMTSIFSRDPHPAFPHLTKGEVSRLDLNMHKRVREPLLKQKAGRMGKVQMRRFKEQYDELVMSVLRAIIRKPEGKRTAQELEQVFEYVRGRDFFRTLPIDVIRLLLPHLSALTYAAKQHVYRADDEVEGVHFILKGKVWLLFDEAQEKQLEGLLDEDSDDSDSSLNLSKMGERAADGRINRRGSRKEVDGPVQRVTGQTVGVADLLSDDWSGWTATLSCKKAPQYRATAIAVEATDVFFLPADVLSRLLREVALRECVKVLREIFPPTSGWDEERIFGPSNVKREPMLPDSESNTEKCESEVPRVHELFEMTQVNKGHTFFQAGEKFSRTDARIVVVVSGEVHLKDGGRVLDTIEPGSVLGEDAIFDQCYKSSGVVSTPLARTMSISVADFFQQFVGRKSPQYGARLLNIRFGPSELVELKPLKDGPDSRDLRDGRRGQGCAASSSRRFVRKNMLVCKWWTEELKRPANARADLSLLGDEHWRLLQPKCLPRRVAPLEGVATSSGKTSRTQALVAQQQQRRESFSEGSPRSTRSRAFGQSASTISVSRPVIDRITREVLAEEIAVAELERMHLAHKDGGIHCCEASENHWRNSLPSWQLGRQSILELGSKVHLLSTAGSTLLSESEEAILSMQRSPLQERRPPGAVARPGHQVLPPIFKLDGD